MNTATLERPMLTATVTVANVYPVKPGRQSGTVKDTDGQLFAAYPKVLAQLEPGATYEISFTEKNVNGVIYRDIKHATPIAQAPKPRSLSSAATHEAAPKQNGNGWYRPTSPADKKSMFRCACVTAAIKSRQVALDRQSIAALVREIDAGYDDAVGTD